MNRDLESFTLHYPGFQMQYEVEDEYYLKTKKKGGGPKRWSKVLNQLISILSVPNFSLNIFKIKIQQTLNIS